MMIRLMAFLAVLVVASLPAVAAAPVQILLAHAQRPEITNDTAAAAADEFRRQVATLSQGRLKVEILADGIVGGNRDTTALVDKGIIHSALVTVGGVTHAYRPLTVIQLPFALDDQQTAHRVLDGPFGTRLAEGLAAATGLRLLGFVDPGGFHVLTNSDREVHVADDMWGLRIRQIPGSKPLEAIIRSVLAVPMKVSSRDEMAALATKAIDGQMNPPSVVLARGFDAVQQYAIVLNHLYAPYVWIFNKQMLDSLPAADAEIILKASRIALGKGRSMALALARSDRGLSGLKKRMIVHTPTAAERATFVEVMVPAAEEAIVKEIGEGGAAWIRDYRKAIREAK